MGHSPAQLPSDSADFARWRRHFRDEWSKAVLYERLGEIETDRRRIQALRRLSALEYRQAEHWAQRFPPAQRTTEPGLRPRDRLLLWFARRFGVRAVLPLLATEALRGVESYRREPDAAPALITELEVAKEVSELIRPSPALVNLGRDHRRHTTARSGLRAAVFGMNDGLVSNFSLVMGVAGVAPPKEFILLAGLAGLLAGALSMAVGEYSSVLAQRELLERQLAVERQHIALAPEAEQAMLAQRYLEKGLSPSQAAAVAGQLMADPDKALDTIAREQLGLDPEDLGSPLIAAIASFSSFAVGALIPLIPFLLASGWGAVIASALLSAAALFLVGVGVSFFTGRHFLVSGLRMLGLGGIAAAATFLTGHLVGISLAG